MYYKFEIPVDDTGCNGDETNTLLIPTDLPEELNNVLTFEEYLSIVKKCNSAFHKKFYAFLIFLVIIIAIVVALPKAMKKEFDFGIFAFIVFGSVIFSVFCVVIVYFIILYKQIKYTIKKLNLQYSHRNFNISYDKYPSQSLFRVNINYSIVQNTTPQHTQGEPQSSSIGIELHSFSNLYPPETSIDLQTSPEVMETPSYNIDYNTTYEDACDNIPYEMFDDDKKK
ncbi:hypothetical protein DICPUDRAFT_79157 [Dictyostelium purpureum]|uniref:Uncharacterized protein n=1 Tax=Dictyostelium purpureum TaxID=5786 RepID=F0ZLR1_DICPU|nr:uncharacterized protein DICPUDRAFT_79157 [Dictyostelium purpureum]EGC35113.1 hypothetical protein DICPUDRAFT_79157 [Dictyostelium purpureum]|eukprot:XP_003288365.1 hypothetical protein DICPUDRAFT_79157 [Dictyostelium purpureum]